MFNKVFAFALLLLFITCGASRASAQQCPVTSSTGPDTPSRTAALRGRLVHHDGIRNWYELKLDRAVCGQKTIQLTVSDDKWKRLESVRGCHVVSHGTIGFSPTGYYLLDLFQDAVRVEPVGACVRQRPFIDYSTARPAKGIRSYSVEMHVDYRPGDHPITFHVRHGRKDLHPWQAYASSMLTGGFVLYGLCGDGFAVDRVYGTRAARPVNSDEPRGSGDMAQFDPETAAQSGKADLHLGYSCVRAR